MHLENVAQKDPQGKFCNYIYSETRYWSKNFDVFHIFNTLSALQKAVPSYYEVFGLDKSLAKF